MTPRVTIDDIAAAVGVSRQTVTRAMNGMPRISEATRARVLEASERLGYRPSRFASNLARLTKATTIGLVVDSFRNPYYSELTAELLDAASAKGWQVTVWSHENEPEIDLLSRIASEVDAVVGYIGETDESKILAAARGVPLVLLGRESTSPGVHSVDFDFADAFGVVVEQARSRGSRRFGMLESHRIGSDYVVSGRRRAYEEVLDPESARAIVVCDATSQSVDAGEQGMLKLLRAYPDTDTVITFSDLMAMGAIRAAHSRGLDIPGDVRIIGIDGLSLGAVTSPTLSSLALINAEFVSHVCELLAHVLDAPATEAQHRVSHPEMIWRESA